MADSTLDITQSFDRPQKLLKLYDNGDGTYNVGAGAKIIDLDGHIANVQAVVDEIAGDEYGVVVISLLHGKDSQGDWHDVKVTPAGSLAVESTIAGVDAGVVFDAHQVDDDGNSIIYTGPNTGAKGVRVFVGPTDPISDLPVFVPAEHHHLHEGETHQYTYPPAALANNVSVDFRVVVGNLTATTKTPHMAIELDSTGESWLYLYETPTTSADGTLQTVYNRNRNSAVTPGTSIYLAPTVTNVGTLLSAWIVGSGEKSGGHGRDSIEWGLAANTTYLVRVTAKNANNIALRMMWYEDLGV